MGKEETLLKIKAAEAEVRAMRDAAERDRDLIAREARREALDLRDRLRGEIEGRYRDIVANAEAAVHGERERILAQGRAEADRLRGRGRENLERAVDLVVTKFRGALDA